MYKNPKNLNHVDLKFYTYLVVICVSIILICDTVAFLTVPIFGHEIAASGAFFPLSFLLLGVIANNYGYEKAGQVVWFMMFAQALFIGAVFFMVWLTTRNDPTLHPIITNNHLTNTEVVKHAYYVLFHHYWQVLLGSTLAVIAAYFGSNFFVSVLKTKAKIRLLETSTILRILVSTGIGKAILVGVSYPFNFHGVKTMPQIVHLAISTWIFKMIIAVIFCFIIPILTRLIKSIDHSDIYDNNISYNPFSVFKTEK